jgi:hypothetical protein
MMQKQIFARVIFASALLALVGCATASAPQGDMAAGTAAEAKAAIAAADKARKKAAGVEGEWRDIGKMLKKAKKAVEKGDYAKATKLAKKAKRQGELGYQQAVSQKELKMPSYLKY